MLLSSYELTKKIAIKTAKSMTAKMPFHFLLFSPPSYPFPLTSSISCMPSIFPCSFCCLTLKPLTVILFWNRLIIFRSCTNVETFLGVIACWYFSWLVSLWGVALVWGKFGLEFSLSVWESKRGNWTCLEGFNGEDFYMRFKFVFGL